MAFKISLLATEYAGISKATSKTIRAPSAHVWHFADGRSQRLDMHTDTLLTRCALNGDAAGRVAP